MPFLPYILSRIVDHLTQLETVAKAARHLVMQMHFSVFIDRIRNQFIKK